MEGKSLQSQNLLLYLLVNFLKFYADDNAMRITECRSSILPGYPVVDDNFKLVPFYISTLGLMIMTRWHENNG